MPKKPHEDLVDELVAAGATRPCSKKNKGMFFAVRRLAKKYKMDLEGINETLKTCHLVPDAWKYEEHPTDPEAWPGTFIAYEVSGSLPIPHWRLEKYAMLWFYLDCDDIGLRLVEKSRTGEAEISLIGIYFECMTGKNGKIDKRFWDPNYELPAWERAIAAHMNIDAAGTADPELVRAVQQTVVETLTKQR